MNYSEFVNELYVENNDDVASRAAMKRVVDSVFRKISDTASNGDVVAVPRFGRFYQKSQSARTARVPATGESIHVPAKTKLGFHASSAQIFGVNE